MSVNNPMHVERYRAIKPFVTFKLDLRKKLTKSEKNKIRRYYNQLADIDTRFTQKYAPRSAANLKVAQKAAGLKGSQFKAVPVRPIIKGQKVSVRKGTLQFTGIIGNSTVYPLNQTLLLKSGADPACRKAKVPRRVKDNQEYQILTDQNPANGTLDTYRRLVEKLDDYLVRYGPSEEVKRFDVVVHTYAQSETAFANNVLDSENVRTGTVKHRKKKTFNRKKKSTKARRK